MNLTASKARVTLRDIAHRLKVSHTTVSRALRNDLQISEAVRQKVQATAKEMGHRPDPLLSALAQYRHGKMTKSISAELAWINWWPDPRKLRSYREFNLYWQGAFNEAEQSGFRLEEFVIGRQMSAERLQKILQTRNIRGVLIPPHGGNTVDWGDFDWENFCVVRFGHSVTTPRSHLVTSDQLTDGIIAVENIWNKGYRRIGLVISETAQTRFSAGYFYRQKVWPPRQRIPALELSESGGSAVVRKIHQWLDRYKPDAILTDLRAMPEWLQQSGYEVPKDIGLATLSVLDGGIDAGINQNSEEIGRAAVQLLISLINHNESGIPRICREVLVEGSWVDGQTLPSRSA